MDKLKRYRIIFILFLTFISVRANSIFAADKTFNAIASPFPPFTDPGLKGKGVAWEICKTVLEIQGYTVKLEFAPWARAMEESKKGNYDGLLPTYKTKERTRCFLYPMPLITIHTGFIKHKKRKDIIYNGDLSTLTAYNIGVGKDYSTDDEFDKAGYLNKVFITTTPQILKMLWLGHLDLAVGGLEYSLYYLAKINKEEGFKGIKEDLVIIHPPRKKRNAYLVIPIHSYNSEDKLKDFNIGMKKIMDNGMYLKIIEKYEFANYFKNNTQAIK